MTISFGLNKLLRHFVAGAKTNPVGIVPQRFFQVFRDHGVEESQIPRLLPQLKLDDLQAPEKLLAALTHEILDQTAQLFGVRSQWLEGVDEQIYEYMYCYKEPALLLEQLASLQAFSEQDRQNFPLRVLTDTKHLDYGDPDYQPLVPVLVEKIAELGDKDICRYYVYRDGFDWSHEPARIQLKAMALRIYRTFHSPVPLFVISSSEIQDVIDGKVIPAKYINRGGLLTNPSLEDYALDKNESVVAKEVDELPAVLKYIQDHNLQGLVFDRPDSFQEPIESSETTTPPPVVPGAFETQKQKKNGKRDQAQADWELARNFASTRWATNDQLSITDVVRDIKGMPILKVSAFSASAIRKQIADLAPPNIRGKSGRKPNKST